MEFWLTYWSGLLIEIILRNEFKPVDTSMWITIQG